MLQFSPSPSSSNHLDSDRDWPLVIPKSSVKYFFFSETGQIRWIVPMLKTADCPEKDEPARH